MTRKLLAVLALAGVALFLSAGVASAKDYVPAPVTVSVNAVNGVTHGAALGNSSAVGSALSYTGSGINVGGTVLIGALILLIGVGLCVAGAKLTKRRSA